MNKSRAFGVGVAGALMITIVTAIGRGMGMPNMEMMLGSMVTGAANTGTWLLGLVMHLVAGGVFALIYATLFERVTHRAGVGLGLAFGTAHAVIAGLALGLIPMVHRAIPEVLPAPGIFAINLGVAATIGFIVVHMAYGAIVGGGYARVAHPVGRPAAAGARS